jgi:two-component system cell cycle sensor histidine kinase/response regulator CckA
VPALRRDGSIFPAELTVGELRLERDRQYVGVIRDISERKQQEARVRDSLRRFQEIAERIEDVFYVMEPASGQVLYVSPAFDRIFGRSLSQEGGPSWAPWIHTDDRERVQAALTRAAASGELDQEYRIVRPDGTERIVRDRAYPMRQENRITGIVHDITDERRLEQEARHAQRLEAVGTLASGIAHDFNNLLMGLAGLAKQALRALPEEHAAAALVKRSLESTERGVALTRQLLMFSGQRRAPAQPVELDAACRAARELLDRMVGEHIHLTMETNAPGLGVMAEPGEIEQILLNLATNSRDAMPSGGELVVRTAGDATLSWVTLSVSDTGGGMSAETQARIFEPFYTTKGVGQGTGLGLSTVFAVVRQRGGDVHVDSAPGRGTVMTVKLPVVASNLTSEVSGGATPRGTETVLAVENDALVRETTQGYLHALGYTALAASHPDVALELASRTDRIDLLLSDVMMPGRLGGDLARELKRTHAGLRVLFMSAHPQSELLRLKRIEPDDGLLCKPFGQHELGVALRAVLDRPSGTVPAREIDGPDEPAWAHGALIVDDDPDVAEAMRDALEEAGVSATVAHSGTEALRLAGTLHPDLVLCDVGLGRGGMSGYDVARALRADAGTRDALLVAVTGLPSEQCGADATAAGFNQVLTKPIDLPMLEELVRHVPSSADHGSR